MTSKRPPFRDEVVLHHAPSLPAADVTMCQDIKCTTPVRTICDLAGVLSPADLEIALDDCLRRRLFSLARLRWQLGRLPHQGRKGSGQLRTLIEGRDPGYVPHSPLETRIGRVIYKSDLIPPETQFRLFDRKRFLARFDFAWPQIKVGVECESYTFHSGRADWRRDTTRFNEAASMGWKVFRATEEDARTPERFLAELSRVVPKRTQLRFSRKSS